MHIVPRPTFALASPGTMVKLPSFAAFPFAAFAFDAALRLSNSLASWFASTHVKLSLGVTRMALCSIW